MGVLFDVECSGCKKRWETLINGEAIGCICPDCGEVAFKIFSKLTVTYKEKDQPWGTSYYKEQRSKRKVV